MANDRASSNDAAPRASDAQVRDTGKDTAANRVLTEISDDRRLQTPTSVSLTPEREAEKIANAPFTQHGDNGQMSFRFDKGEHHTSRLYADSVASIIGKTGDQKPNQSGGDQSRASESKSEPGDKTHKGDQTREGDRIQPNAEASKERNEFLNKMRDRLSDADYEKLQGSLDKIDQRVLHTDKVEENGRRRGADGAQQELAETYKQLNRLADADKGEIYKNVPGGQDIVNRGVLDAANRLADPRHAFNQGGHDTCGAQSIDREAAAIKPSEYTKKLADIANTGKFTAQGADGKPLTVEVDQASLRRTDSEARNASPWANGDERGVAGFWGDYGTAQLNLDLKHGSGERIYKNDTGAPRHGNVTAEGIYDKKGNYLQDGTELDREGAVATKQSYFGNKLGADYAEKTTLTREDQWGSGQSSAAEVQNQLNENKRRGWDMSLVAVHSANWRGSEGFGGAGSWHAVSAEATADGKAINLYNNWGGHLNAEGASAKSAADMFALMKAPDHASIDDRTRKDHYFDPDGRARVYHGTGEAPSLKEREERKAEAQQKREDRKEEKEDRKEQGKEERKDRFSNATAAALSDAEAKVQEARARYEQASRNRDDNGSVSAALTELLNAQSSLSKISHI